MNMLIAAAIVFLAIHFLISGTRLRDTIAGAIGEKPYRGLFSLISLAAIIWLCWAYNVAQASGSDPVGTVKLTGFGRPFGFLLVPRRRKSLQPMN